MSNLSNEILVSFITINYNSSAYTIELIKSIKKYTTLCFEIIVVDNKSKEDDYRNLEIYVYSQDYVKLIKSEKNGGFASGNMIGFSEANGKYLFFINNDTKLLNDASLIMSKYLDINMEVALVTGKVEDELGNFSSSYKLFPSLIKELFGNVVARKFSKYNFPSNKVKLDKPSLVEVVSGSCMFFRAIDFRKIGGFDTEFFLYCEEEDLSKRVWNFGRKVVFLPEAEIYHYSGGSIKKSFEIEREFYISYFILLKKHFSLSSRVILKFLLLFKLFRRSFKRKNGWKLFLCFMQGCPKKFSCRSL